MPGMFPLSASQTISAVAIAAVLAAGAYALGRSQGTPVTTAPSESAVSNSLAPVESAKVAKLEEAPPLPAPVPVPVAVPVPVVAPVPVAAKPAAAPSPALCANCLRVVNVHTEQRKAESGSGAGAVGGAVLGGLLGNRVGGGTGRKLATLGGAVAGGYAGNEIEKNVNKTTVWIVELKSADGHVRHREQHSDPQVQSGDIVSIRDGHLVRR